jgi:hypothetical protein
MHTAKRGYKERNGQTSIEAWRNVRLSHNERIPRIYGRNQAQRAHERRSGVTRRLKLSFSDVGR